MPEKLHRELTAQARKKGLSGPRRDAYVFGTMNRIKKRQGLATPGSNHGSHNSGHKTTPTY